MAVNSSGASAVSTAPARESANRSSRDSTTPDGRAPPAAAVPGKRCWEIAIAVGMTPEVAGPCVTVVVVVATASSGVGSTASDVARASVCSVPAAVGRARARTVASVPCVRSPSMQRTVPAASTAQVPAVASTVGSGSVAGRVNTSSAATAVTGPVLNTDAVMVRTSPTASGSGPSASATTRSAPGTSS